MNNETPLPPLPPLNPPDKKKSNYLPVATVAFIGLVLVGVTFVLLSWLQQHRQSEQLFGNHLPTVEGLRSFEPMPASEPESGEETGQDDGGAEPTDEAKQPANPESGEEAAGISVEEEISTTIQPPPESEPRTTIETTSVQTLSPRHVHIHIIHEIDTSTIVIAETPPETPLAPPTADPEATDIDDQYPLISQEIKDLAERISLTHTAKRIFYDHNPVLVATAAEIKAACSLGAEVAGFLHGCWKKSPKRLYILNDARVETTAVHELLHAVYYKNYGGSVPRFIKNQINVVAEQQPEKVKDVLRPYALATSGRPAYVVRWIQYNELHSFLGTEFDSLPQELEDYYAIYIKDRSVVLGFDTAWHQSFAAKLEAGQKLKERYQKQVDEYKKCRADLTIEDCQQYDLYEEFVAFGECLSSTFTLYKDCSAIDPALIRYEDTSSDEASLAVIQLAFKL